jgi:crotonobetainyl-CoA:carnitine CoA-transferase CaiB-like acyl-CoA transferase
VLPLADIRILAVEQFGAGPWATLQLGDLGADVIKIEDPTAGGDVGRYVPPFQDGEDSLFFETFNRNKRSISLDLRDDAGRQAFGDLVGAVDVVFSNLRGDQPERLGLTYDALKVFNPRIVCCSLSGFGMSGPRRAEGGYDYVMQGMAGWMTLTGEPAGPPTKSGLSLVDLSGGYVAAIAIMAGLWRARREGLGCDCDISLFETALAELCYVGTWAASRDYEPPRRASSAHPSIVPFQNFATADGWLVVACPKQKFWVELCRVLGRPKLASDPRFADFAGRDRHRDELLPLLEEAFLERTTDAWLEALRQAGIPNGPINLVGDALEDPQAVARGAVVGFDHPRLGPVRELATPLRVGEERRPAGPAPQRGEHTGELLRELCGYSDEQIDHLRAGEAFGPVRSVNPDESRRTD